MTDKKSLPTLTAVIKKIKQLEDLTPEEELVYYTRIEKIPKEEAKRILANSFQAPLNDKYAY